MGREFKAFSPTIGHEFIRLSQDVASGIPRHDALKNLTKRIRCKDLQSFVALLIQSETMGTGIVHPLSVYCDTLRSRKKQRVEEHCTDFIRQNDYTNGFIPSSCNVYCDFISINY